MPYYQTGNPKKLSWLLRIAQLPEDLRRILMDDLSDTIENRISTIEDIAESRERRGRDSR